MFKQTIETNREAWLNRARVIIDETMFKPLGYMLPKVKVAVGFTGSRSSKAIGVCWKGIAANDGQAQIYIIPTIDDSIRVLDILVHELIHAIFPDDGHGKKFGKAARELGLAGKLTATYASDELKIELAKIVAEIGEIPHSALSTGLKVTPKGETVPKEAKPVGAPKKQGTRMHKVECQKCGYTVRISNKWIDKGLPTCVCGGIMEGGV